MSKGVARWLQLMLLMAFSTKAFASGMPTMALFFPYLPILAYLICACIWALKSRLWSTAQRWLLVILVFPLFSMVAFFIPLLLVTQNQYFDITLFASSAVLTALVIGVCFWSLAKS